MSDDGYEYLKRHHRCVRCEARDARTESGKVLCERCNARQRDRQTPEAVEANRRCARERRARLKAAGLCVRCGARPARSERVSCEECARRDSYLSYAKRNRPDTERMAG